MSCIPYIVLAYHNCLPDHRRTVGEAQQSHDLRPLQSLWPFSCPLSYHAADGYLSHVLALRKPQNYWPGQAGTNEGGISPSPSTNTLQGRSNLLSQSSPATFSLPTYSHTKMPVERCLLKKTSIVQSDATQYPFFPIRIVFKITIQLRPQLLHHCFSVQVVTIGKKEREVVDFAVSKLEENVGFTNKTIFFYNLLHKKSKHLDLRH